MKNRRDTDNLEMVLSLNHPSFKKKQIQPTKKKKWKKKIKTETNEKKKNKLGVLGIKINILRQMGMPPHLE